MAHISGSASGQIGACWLTATAAVEEKARLEPVGAGAGVFYHFAQADAAAFYRSLAVASCPAAVAVQLHGVAE